MSSIVRVYTDDRSEPKPKRRSSSKSRRAAAAEAPAVVQYRGFMYDWHCNFCSTRTEDFQVTTCENCVLCKKTRWFLICSACCRTPAARTAPRCVKCPKIV
jgi:hypothetical protein